MTAASYSVEEASELLRQHAFTSEVDGRTVIHSRLGGLGADHDLEDALRIVEASVWRGYVPSIMGHNLGVETPEGKVYCYDVRLDPPKDPQP